MFAYWDMSTWSELPERLEYNISGTDISTRTKATSFGCDLALDCVRAVRKEDPCCGVPRKYIREIQGIAPRDFRSGNAGM